MRAWFVAGLLSFLGTAHASLITIDPRGFLPGTDISNATPGVTLSNWTATGGRNNQYSTGPILAENCTGCSPVLEGQRIFTNENGVWFGGAPAASWAAQGHSDHPGFGVFRADFSEFTNYVEIIGGGHADESGGDPLFMAAIGKDGTLLASCIAMMESQTCVGGATRTLLSPQLPGPVSGLWKISIDLDFAEIATIVAGGTSASARVATLTFNQVPEPATWSLAVLGLLGTIVARRRSSQGTGATMA